MGVSNINFRVVIKRKVYKDKENSISMTIENKLIIGKMPEPCYLTEMGDTYLPNEGNPVKWIGMKSYGIDEQVKKFLWWRNFEPGDLNDKTARHHAAAFVARLYMEMKVETAIGKAVDLNASNQSKNHVALINKPKFYGVYVQEDKRDMFNFYFAFKVIRTEAELRKENPIEFNRIFQQAQKVLPYDRK